MGAVEIIFIIIIYDHSAVRLLGSREKSYIVDAVESLGLMSTRGAEQLFI